MRVFYDRDSVNSSNMATKPHDMPLNEDLTSDELTQQLHLSAKSPMSDDSGVVLGEDYELNLTFYFMSHNVC